MAVQLGKKSLSIDVLESTFLPSSMFFVKVTCEAKKERYGKDLEPVFKISDGRIFLGKFELGEFGVGLIVEVLAVTILVEFYFLNGHRNGLNWLDNHGGYLRLGKRYELACLLKMEKLRD